MKRKTTIERLAAAALCLVLMLGLAACGGKTAPEPENQEKQEEQQAAASERLRGIFEALTAPDSDYTQSKQSMAEYYPEVEYSEELGTDRFTISVKANGNEYVQDGSWEFVEDVDRDVQIALEGGLQGYRKDNGGRSCQGNGGERDRTLVYSRSPRSYRR